MPEMPIYEYPGRMETMVMAQLLVVKHAVKLVTNLRMPFILVIMILRGIYILMMQKVGQLVEHGHASIVNY